jgi:hypothetical protein
MSIVLACLQTLHRIQRSTPLPSENIASVTTRMPIPQLGQVTVADGSCPKTVPAAIQPWR